MFWVKEISFIQGADGKLQKLLKMWFFFSLLNTCQSNETSDQQSMPDIFWQTLQFYAHTISRCLEGPQPYSNGRGCTPQVPSGSSGLSLPAARIPLKISVSRKLRWYQDKHLYIYIAAKMNMKWFTGSSLFLTPHHRGTEGKSSCTRENSSWLFSSPGIQIFIHHSGIIWGWPTLFFFFIFTAKVSHLHHLLMKQLHVL